MLRKSILTKDDLEESMMLRRRQIYEDERKKGIFDAPKRCHGFDWDYLNRSIRECQERRAYEKDILQRYDNVDKGYQRTMYSKKLEQNQRLKMLDHELTSYRTNMQGKETTREFDVNDPAMAKGQMPLRTSDQATSTLGLSSAQVFAGEDPHFSQRRALQRQQQRAWLDQQIAEKAEANAFRKKANQESHAEIYERHSCLTEVAKDQDRVKAALTDVANRYNQEMINEKNAKKARAKLETREDDIADMCNMEKRRQIAEERVLASWKSDPSKKEALANKRMTLIELKDLRGDQIAKVHLKQENEEMINKQWEQYQLNMAHALKLKQREFDRWEEALRTQHIMGNKALGIEQRKQIDHYNKVGRRNVITHEFYDCFNRNSR